MTAPGAAPRHPLPLVVWVPGRARTKGSLRPQGRTADGRVRLVEQVRLSGSWRATVVEVVLRHLGASFGPDGPVVGWEAYAGPVSVQLAVRFPRPDSADRPYPTARTDGDLDKLQRNVGDALQDARVILDDAQIVEWHAVKSWAPPLSAGIWLVVTPAVGG